MDDEKNTGYSGGSREGNGNYGSSNKGGSAKTETNVKGEGKTPHADKLKTETSRSQAMRGKYRSGNKTTEGKPKVKTTGSGKKNPIKPRIGLPSPPPPGSVNFTGNIHAEDNNSAEDIRDAAGNIGILAISARKAHPRLVGHYHAPEHQVDLSRMRNSVKGEEISEARARARYSGGDGKLEGHANTHEASHPGYADKISNAKYTNRFAQAETGEADASNKASRAMQKKRTRTEMMRSAKAGEAQGSSFGNTISNFFTNVGEKLENVAQKIAETIMVAVKDNPLVLGIAGAVGIVIITLTGTFSSLGMLFSGGGNTVMVSSFTAADSDIRAVEKDYQKLEENLSTQMDNLKTDNPGYDEYNLNIATISHDPFELAALLTVLHEDYNAGVVKDTLQTVIDSQYTLTTSEKIEKRKKKETKWHYVTKTRQETRYKVEIKNGKVNLVPYTVDVEYQVLESYEEWVEYDYKIFNATLTAKSIDAVVDEMALTDVQRQRYEVLLMTKGNKENVFNE